MCTENVQTNLKRNASINVAMMAVIKKTNKTCVKHLSPHFINHVAIEKWRSRHLFTHELYFFLNLNSLLCDSAEEIALCRVYTRTRTLPDTSCIHLYPVVAVNMYLVSATKLSPVCRSSVAGYKGIQVDRDINELYVAEMQSTCIPNKQHVM